MEQVRVSRPIDAANLRPAAADKSLVDCLFAMPEKALERRASQAQRADVARVEAKLAAQMRSLIAGRLRADRAG